MGPVTDSSFRPTDDTKVTKRSRRNVWQLFVEPSGAIREPEARRRARLLSTLLVILTPFTLAGAVAIVKLGTAAGPMPPAVFVLIGASAVLVAAYVLSRTRNHDIGITLTLATFSAIPFARVIAEGAYTASAFVWMALTIVLSLIFLSMQGVAVLSALNLLGLALLASLVADVTFEDVVLMLGFNAAIAGAVLVAARYRDLVEQDRQAELLERNRELEAVRSSLEQRVADRTQDLARRARYLETTAAIARDTAGVLDLHYLLSRVVTLISEQLGFYHAGLFLLDPTRQWAVLQAASSQGGQRMLDRGHRLQVGQGIVGYVVDRGKPRIALDVGEDSVFSVNPDLRDTRSEMALPLRTRGEVIGALDVQSLEPGAFSSEDVEVLQTLADQVAVAISNARLFRQAQESLEAERRAYGELSHKRWRELIRSKASLGYRYSEHGVEPVWGDSDRHGTSAKTLPELVLPVKYLDQTLGTIRAHKPPGTGSWVPEEIELMETLAEQLTMALENARLYQDTQRHAAREQLIGEVTSRMRETLDMDMMLQTAIREIGEALDMAEVEVKMGWSSAQTPPELPARTSGDGCEAAQETLP